MRVRVTTGVVVGGGSVFFFFIWTSRFASLGWHDRE